MNQKQLELLNEIKVKMFYDPQKTLTEQETRFTKDLDRQFSTPEGARKYIDTIKPYRHEIIQLTALGSLFIPFVGPLIGTSLEVADTAMYIAENDPYMAGLSALFALIGLNQIPELKNYSKRFLLNTFKKAKAGSKVTQEELEAIQKVVRNHRRIKLTSISNILKKILVKQPISETIKFMHILEKYYKFDKFFFQIAGVMIGYDKLATYFGIKPGNLSQKDKELIESIDEDEFNNEVSKYLNSMSRQFSDEQLDSLALYLSKLPPDIYQ
jgi:hypothetical protein